MPLQSLHSVACLCIGSRREEKKLWQNETLNTLLPCTWHFYWRFFFLASTKAWTGLLRVGTVYQFVATFGQVCFVLWLVVACLCTEKAWHFPFALISSPSLPYSTVMGLTVVNRCSNNFATKCRLQSCDWAKISGYTSRMSFWSLGSHLWPL